MGEIDISKICTCGDNKDICVDCMAEKIKELEREIDCVNKVVEKYGVKLNRERPYQNVSILAYDLQNEVEELQQENEKLKNDYETLMRSEKKWMMDAQKMYGENEKLKAEIKEVKVSLRKEEEFTTELQHKYKDLMMRLYNKRSPLSMYDLRKYYCEYQSEEISFIRFRELIDEHYNKCLEEKDAEIKELKQSLENQSKFIDEHCPNISRT